MTYFPLIYTPPTIELAQCSLPPEIPFPEQPPAQPGDDPKQWDIIKTAVETILAAIIIPILAFIPGWLLFLIAVGAITYDAWQWAVIVPILAFIPGWLLFLIAVGAITYDAWRQYKTYPERKQAYQFKATRYAKELPAYTSRKCTYDKEQQANLPGRVVEWRRDQVRKALACTVPHNGEDSSATEGKSENVFRGHLERYFPNKIHVKLTHRIPNHSHPYTPDIAYIDCITALSIDIEVDEPYVYTSGQAIHYDTSESDHKRNQFFVEKGWIVMRFSEQQVICYPDSCCKVVAQKIAQITEDNSIMSQFTNVSDLQQQRQWTVDEASEMAVRKERDNYPIIVKKETGSETDKTG